jgi:hypothetical protein
MDMRAASLPAAASAPTGPAVLKRRNETQTTIKHYHYE